MASATQQATRPGRSTHPLVGFLARRTARFVVSLVILVTVAFLLIHAIPGDPIRASLGLTAPPELVEARRQEFRLDDPLLDQYWAFMSGVARGELGTSMVSGLPVTTEIGNRLSGTLQLAGLAFLVTLVIGIPSGLAIGVLAREGKGRTAEVAFSVGTGVFTVIPQFLLAVGLVFVFAVSLSVLPVAGRTGPVSFVLPVAALALGPAALLARIVRFETLRVLDENYIQTARAKRLPPMRIYTKHVLPNALAATLTVAGLLLASLLAGTVLIEHVFAWPGLGTILVQSILAKDYAMVQGLALVFGAAVLLIHILVDLALAVFNPRSTMVAS